MTKENLRWLEKIFACEIEGRVFQTRSKKVKLLERDGYCTTRTIQFRDKLGNFSVTGYVLTILGNYTYCMSLKDQP